MHWNNSEQRKRRLLKLPPPVRHRLHDHIQDDGAVIFKHACQIGCEGIVSKRLDFAYTLKAAKSGHARLGNDVMLQTLYAR